MNNEPNNGKGNNSEEKYDRPERRIEKGSRRYIELARYSGMALQFFALIAIAAWGGQKIDEHFSTSKPYFTVVLILFFSTGYFIKLYKDLTK